MIFFHLVRITSYVATRSRSRVPTISVKKYYVTHSSFPCVFQCLCSLQVYWKASLTTWLLQRVDTLAVSLWLTLCSNENPADRRVVLEGFYFASPSFSQPARNSLSHHPRMRIRRDCGRRSCKKHCLEAIPCSPLVNHGDGTSQLPTISCYPLLRCPLHFLQ